MDRCSSEFAEFWVRHFAKYCEKFAGAGEVPDYLRKYVAFTVKSLLASETLKELKEFAAHYEALEKINKDLVTPLARAVTSLDVVTLFFLAYRRSGLDKFNHQCLV